MPCDGVCPRAESFVRRARVDWAVSVLSSRSDIPLSFLALEAAFADQAHFTRSVKRVTGLTPAVFRRLRGPDMGPTRAGCAR